MELLEGREWLILSVILAVGNRVVNDEYIPTDVLSFSSPTWAGRPVTLASNMSGSVLTPDVLDEIAIGRIFFPYMAGNLLRAEAWLDKDRCERKGGDAKDIYDRCLAGEQLQTRLGLLVDSVLSPGTIDGNGYSYRWERLGSDHVEILPTAIESSISAGTVAGVNLASGYNAIDISLPQMRAATSDSDNNSNAFPSHHNDRSVPIMTKPKPFEIITNREAYITHIFSQLAEWRKQAGLTQAQLAAKVNVTGATISRWEDHSVNPSYAYKASAVFQVMSACVRQLDHGIKALGANAPPALSELRAEYASQIDLLFQPIKSEEDAFNLLAKYTTPAPDPYSIALGRDLRAEAGRYVLDFSQVREYEPLSLQPLGSGSYKSQPAPDPYAIKFGRNMHTGEKLKK